ncbi:hypothetical protein [Streptomyces sp. NPDC051219]
MPLSRRTPRAWTLGRVLQDSLWEVEDGEEELPEERAEVVWVLLGR